MLRALFRDVKSPLEHQLSSPPKTSQATFTMKAQALLLSACGLTALAASTSATGPTAAVSIQATSTVFETVIETIGNSSPQPSVNSSLPLAKRSDDDDDCVPGSIAPLDVSCEDFSKDVKCHKKSYLENPFGGREETYVSCIQNCRRSNGLNRLIYYKGRYLDMTLEEYDEWIRNGADSKSATAAAAASTTTEAEYTVTVWTNLATTNQPPPSVKAGAKTTTKAVANATQSDDRVESTSFKTSFRTISSSAPLASSSVLLGERSTTRHPCRRARGEQKCRTKCG